MARRSLRPHLNQIRGWVRQGRTDAWIAHQLEVTVQQIEAFKRENDLVPGRRRRGRAGVPGRRRRRLRRRDRPARRGRRAHRRRARGRRGGPRRGGGPPRGEAAEAAEAGDDEDDEEDDDEDAGKKRRRGRRGGRGRRKGAARELEGTFDHGEEGYGLWLDPAVEDNPVYAEHWAGHRPVSVTIEENQIVIRRAGDDEDDDDD